jgi:DNA-binding XRE family transcriptional regulator
METKLNRLIKESGKKKEYIAWKVGVSIYTLTNWCRGTTYPNLRDAYMLKQVLNIKSIDDLVDWEEINNNELHKM